MMKFHDRKEAGLILAEQLKEYSHQSNVIVLALPRGGVPVAYEIAKALAVPLDVFIVRKLGVPGHEELAMGAIASGGTPIFNEDIVQSLRLKQSAIDSVLQSEQKELQRREKLYRGNKPPLALEDKTIILVDDGMATGATMRAAIQALELHKPATIIVAVPVAALSTYEELSPLVNKIICPLKPRQFYAVGLWYEQFTQTSDSEVIELMEKSTVK